MTDTYTVSVLGTGIMGAAMARNLVGAGHRVRVWNRTRAKAEPLAADGAYIAQSPEEAVEGADAIVTMLHDGPAASAAMRQAAPRLREGACWVQSSTAGIDSIPEMAGFARERGLVFFDAPVLGTREPAEAGQLTVLAAGPDADPRAEAVFDAVGARTVRTGEDGAEASATRLKLVVNSWVFALTHGAAEAVSLAEALGVDPRRFLELVSGGPLDAVYLRAKAGLILDRRLSPPSFAVSTAEKDARLIAEAGRRNGVRLDVVEAGIERFRRAAEGGHGGEDMAASYYAGFARDPER